jgi:flagellar hook-associated protein 2
MATITAAGIGSGLDVESIVTQLVALERIPLDNLESDASLIQAQISAYGTLKSKVAEFESAMDALGSADKFKLFAASSSVESVLTANADSAAAAGTYEVNVVALAERDKYRTAAYTDSNTVVGEGTLTIGVGADSFDVVIDSSNSSLSAIRDAINSAADNAGVTASIVTDDSGASLIISSDDTGLDNALTITVAGDSDANDTDAAGLSALATSNLTALSTAVDAQVEIDNSGGNGFTFSSSSNTFTDALDGVTFTAESLGSSTLSINRDDEAILEAVNEFADAYNELRDEISTQRQGQLEADGTLLSIERAILEVLNSGSAITGSSYSYLSEIGITTDDSNNLVVDSTELQAAITSDFDSFVNLFAAADEGYAARFESLASSLQDENGLIDAREDGLADELDRNEEAQARFEVRLESIEARIRAQFTALDTLVSQLNNTGNFLTQQLANISSIGNNSSS